MCGYQHQFRFPVKGLNKFASNRPVFSESDIKKLCEYVDTVIIAKNAYIRNRVLEILEEQAVGRFHAKLASIILGKSGERLTVYKGDRLEIIKIGQAFERVREFFYDICRTPPEFNMEALQDPIERKRIEKYLSVKNRMVYYPIPILIYLFENVARRNVKLIFTRDLVGGEPAHQIGLPGGRDIDYFVTVRGDVDKDLKKFAKKVEYYLDNFFGSAIINYMFKEASVSAKTVDRNFNKPYNEIIKHNIIEVHVINEKEIENHLHISDEQHEGYIEVDEVDGVKIYAKPKASDIKLFNMTKYRLRVRTAIEKALEELGIPLDESKTIEEFEARMEALILEKKIKLGLIKIEEFEY